MAAAVALRKLGVDDIILLDRNPRLGGILNQCIHPGFGLIRYDRDLTGPEYARALEREFDEAGIARRLGAMVLEISRQRVLKVISPAEGYAEIHARSVIVATGCRERTRENLEIAGTRPAGIFTAGQAQNLINLGGFRLGGRVVIQGSGDIGLIMARRLTIEGSRVEAVLERLPYLSGLVRNKVQCLDHFGIPLRFGTQICEIAGKHRVEGVFTEKLDESQNPLPGTREFQPCDTVLFSVGLMPEVDILKGAGFAPPPGRGIAVNSRFEAGETGIFLCGNALHIHDLADNAAKEGESVALHVAQYLRSPEEYRSAATDTLPYRPLPVEKRFDASFFESLRASGEKVCIVCPRGCTVSERAAPCPRGKAYFAESARGRFQPVTTTIDAFSGARRTRFPVKSAESVEVSRIPALKEKISLAAAGKYSRTPPCEADAGFSIDAEGRLLAFSICV